MEQLRLLIQKDLLLWRNSYWRTGKQAAVTMAVALVFAVGAGLIARAVLRWFSPIAEAVQGSLTVNALSPLLALLLAWLFIIFFFSAAQISRERIFLAPDMALLMTTPVNPKIIFAQRLLIFTFFTPFGFFEAAVFGLAPLAALGLMVAAPWFYYVLLLPLIFVYRVIPAALAVTLMMLLMRVLPPRRLYQALAAGNLLLGVLSFYIFWGGAQALLTGWTARLAGVERVLWGLPPLAAARDFLLSLMGGDVSPWLPLIILAGSVVAVMALTLTVLGRIYFYNYERLQTAEKRTPKKNLPGHSVSERRSLAKQSLFLFLIWEHWKTALRNREMHAGTVFFLVLLPAYIFAVETFAFAGPPWVMLLNVAVVAFCANTSVLIIFLPYAMAADRFVLSRQYWIYKIVPVEKSIFAGSLFLAHCLPSLTLALALIIPVSYFTGLAGGGLLPAAGMTALLTVSASALQQLTMLMEAASAGEELPLLSRIIREADLLLYGPLFLMPLAIAFYYRQIGLLSFMHNIPQPVAMAAAVFITVALAAAVTWRSLKCMTTVWQAMEIK